MGKAHQKSLIRQAIERLDGLMAIGESRHEAKKTARELAQEEGCQLDQAFTTGKIHSFKTRTTYQEHVLRFVNWVRVTYRVKTLEALDPCADVLASQWLQLEIEKGQSPYTLQTERASLRMFFGDRQLAGSVELPKRRGVNITRSRRPAARDRHFQPANWPEFMIFQRATGLRRGELQRIRVGDVCFNPAGELVAHVQSGKGGRPRDVPVLAGYEHQVLTLVAGRDPEEPVLRKVPDTDVHGMRRDYAQALYRHYAPGWPALPPKTQRLRPTDYNRAAALQVSAALGHQRLDIVLNNYLR